MDRFSRQPSGTSNQTGAHTQNLAHANNSSDFFAPSMASKTLVVVLIVAAVSVILSVSYSLYASFRATNLVDNDKYQAVFLDNGQVYFGKLSSVNSEYVKINDIFYLQVAQQVQPRQTDGTDDEAQQQPEISLAKLGNELHGPEDEMFILRDKIVFWENLKNDGQVTQAISNYYNGGESEE